MRCTCKNSILYVYQTTSWFSICVHVYAGTADKTNKQMIETSYLLCLQAVNAMETQYIHQKRRASALKSPCKHHEMPPRTPQERGRTQCELRSRRGRREDGVRTSWLPLFTNNFLFLGILRGVLENLRTPCKRRENSQEYDRDLKQH